jgi:hypothetical protein
MRKVFRVLAIVIASLVGIGLLIVAYIVNFLPNVGPAPDIKIIASAQRLERGKYIFYHGAGCVSCHSQRDEAMLTMPVIKGTEGSGGEVFDQRLGFPGSFTAKNLTPTHLGHWTDGEVYRAIVSGVSKDGHALFPIMPYDNYARMTTEDIYSVIAFIRTLKPLTAEWPVSHFDFPMNIIVRTIPEKPKPVTAPDRSNAVAYGEYLVNMASCKTCHTQAKQGKIIESLAFAGGRVMPLPTGGAVHSANITSDPVTGIGAWTKEDFVRRFQSYNDSSFHPTPVGKHQFNSIMPWTSMSKIKTSDLEAIYSYLKTLKPINNKVVKFSEGQQ